MFKRLLYDAVTLVFWNLETAFKVAGAWFALQIVLIFVIQVMIGDAANASGATAARVLSSLIILVVTLVASASIAVAWHRFALFGERPRAIHLQLGPTEGRFVIKSVLLALFLMPIAFGVVFIAAFVGILAGSNTVTVVLSVIGFGALLPHFFRLNLVLPATALERPISFRQAYALGEGLGWPMMLATLALSLPFAVLSFGLQILVDQVTGGLPLVLIQFKALVLNILIQIIVTVLGLSVLTAAYRFAIERDFESEAKAGPAD